MSILLATSPNSSFLPMLVVALVMLLMVCGGTGKSMLVIRDPSPKHCPSCGKRRRNCSCCHR